jgi:hypothetical protein
MVVVSSPCHIAQYSMNDRHTVVGALNIAYGATAHKHELRKPSYILHVLLCILRCAPTPKRPSGFTRPGQFRVGYGTWLQAVSKHSLVMVCGSSRTMMIPSNFRVCLYFKIFTPGIFPVPSNEASNGQKIRVVKLNQPLEGAGSR